MLHAGYQCPCRVHGSDTVDTGFDRCTTDQEAVSRLIPSLGRCINDKVNLMSKDQIHNSRGFLGDLVDLSCMDSCFL